jgi:drug/metabolite transporter (DMT)-like permease
MTYRSILYVLGGAISYGVLSTVVKSAYKEGYHVGEVLGSQVFTGWCLLLLLQLLLIRRRTAWRQWLPLAATGTFSALTGWLYYSSLTTVPASVAIVLLFQFSWIGVLLEAVTTRRLPDRYKASALPVLFIGTLLAGGIGAGELSWGPGMVYGLLSAVSFALFIFSSGKVEVGLHPVQRAFVMTTGGMLLAFLMFPPHYLADGSFFTGGLWKFGLLLGLFGMVLPNMLFAAGMPKVGPGLGTILSSAELPTAVLLSCFILGEKVSPSQWAGVVLILCGIALPQLGLRLAKRRPPRPSRTHQVR